MVLTNILWVVNFGHVGGLLKLGLHLRPFSFRLQSRGVFSLKNHQASSAATSVLQKGGGGPTLTVSLQQQEESLEKWR